jgi:hypothetical protein
VLISFWGVISVATPVLALGAPAICGAGSGGAGSADGTQPHRYSCLLCLPGCAALAAGDVAPLPATLPYRTGIVADAPLLSSPTQRIACAHQPRAPPA